MPLPLRIVSLLPSATEIVYALGLEDDLVGVSFECDEPARARRDHEVVVGGLDTRALAPAEIDRVVRERMARGDDLYTLHEDALAGLDPTLILTQDLCRVCALSTDRVDDALAHLGCRAEVVSLDPFTLQEVIASVGTVAAACGAAERGAEIVAGLHRRLDDVRAAVAGHARPRTAVVEWVDPLFTGGHWIPDLVSAAGGDPVAGHPGARSVPSTWDDLRAAEPDVVVVAPCGFGLAACAEQATGVALELPGTPIWAIDADGSVVRPGPRVVEGVEALASVLHPDQVAAHPAVRQVAE